MQNQSCLYEKSTTLVGCALPGRTPERRLFLFDCGSEESGPSVHEERFGFQSSAVPSSESCRWPSAEWNLGRENEKILNQHEMSQIWEVWSYAIDYSSHSFYFFDQNAAPFPVHIAVLSNGIFVRCQFVGAFYWCNSSVQFVGANHWCSFYFSTVYDCRRVV